MRGTYDPAVPVVRDRADACPGALTLHEAADGLLARVRLPGGLVTPAQLTVLAELAVAHGDGRLELTSRGNLQLRGLADGAVAGPLADAGLLPSPTHERVRNIVASPLSGLDGSTDVTPLVRDLDRALCARQALAGLPGRFLFAVDDGRGDVARLGADVTLLPDAAVADAVAVAADFLEARAAQGSRAWRIAELDGAGRELRARPSVLINGVDSGVGNGALSGAASNGAHDAPARPAGPVGEAALVVLAPLGRLDAAQARWAAARFGTRGVRVTPWQSLVVTDVADRSAALTEAQALGLGVDAASPWYRVSACTGRPGCARALADVQADARAATDRWPGQVVRWSGCARRCGRPRDTEVDVIATENGYRVHA
jgi:precorrin-3B synthase